jgi:hypothetical protein
LDACVIRSFDDLITVIRARIAELQITHETVDDVSGLQSGYSSKLLANIRRLGPLSFSALLPALGLKVTVSEDTEALARVASRLVKRKFAPRPDHWRHRRRRAA